MLNKITVFLISSLIAGIAVAESDYIALKVIDDIQKGKATKNAITTLRVTGNATVGGTVTTTGATTTSGDATFTAGVTLTDANSNAVITVTGFEASDAILILDADQGDDTADTWTIEAEATGNDLSIMNGVTEVLNLTTAGALALDSSVDATAFTADAGAGLDNQAAGALLLGAATATSVEIADAGVTTDIQGPVIVLGGIDTAGAAALVLGAATATSVEIADTTVNTDIQGTLSVAEQTTLAAGAVGTPSFTFTGRTNGLYDVSATQIGVSIEGSLVTVLDDLGVAADSVDSRIAGAMLIGAVTATSVEIADAAVTTDIQGPVTVLGGIDTAGAAALVLGAATATSVEIADAGVTTDVQGPLTILGTTGAGLDTAAANALYIGEATATSLVLGAADIATTVPGTITAPSYGRTVYAGANETNTLTATSGSVITADTTTGAVALTVPDANDVLGATYTIILVTDGGTDLTIARGGTDTFNSTGNTLLTFADAEDAIVMTAISANRWLIEENIGTVVASTP
jgi:hypothetical protein